MCQAPFLGSPRAIARSVGGRRGIRKEPGEAWRRNSERRSYADCASVTISMHDVVAERRARQGAKQNRERHLCQAPFLGSPRAIARSAGGRRGIRTPGCLHINGFQDRRFRPLSQPSVISHCSALRTLLRPTVPKSLTFYRDSGAYLLIK